MDSSENMDKFISNKLSFSTVLVDYYQHFIPWINGELWPLFAFLAVIFFTSRLARDSEIISLLSAGIKYERILRPMLLAGTFIAVMHWVGENYVIPKSTFHMNEFRGSYIKKSMRRTTSSNIQFFVNENDKIYAQSYYNRDSSIRIFRLEHFNDDGQLTAIFKADEMKFKALPDIWTAKSYELREFNGIQETIRYGKGESMDTTIAMIPGDFIQHAKQMEIMTTPDLKEFVVRERAKGLGNTKTYTIEMYKRTAAPFTILILTIIGAAIGTRKVRGGLGLHLALGVGLGALFVVLSKFSETFATNLAFAPLLGVWIPNILFGLLSIYLLSKAQK
ncbi:MAG: lipopolysaccharide export system permease protein [Saprospiraceae bacterium]|jgi:lipopolysaccharide export system permease protein